MLPDVYPCLPVCLSAAAHRSLSWPCKPGNQKGLAAEAACLLYYSLVNMPTEIEDVPVCLRARHPCAPMPQPVAQWPAAATTPLALQVWQ